MPTRDDKPLVTGGTHRLPFGQLDPLKFEELCLWLVRREGYERAEHLGQSGSEQGRDIVAWKDGKRFAFQCKRVIQFSAANAVAEIRKIRGMPPDRKQPDEFVFLVTTAVSDGARDKARKEWGDEATCHFWAGSELDERVKRYPDIVGEFFQVTVPPPPTFVHNLPYPSLGDLMQGRDAPYEPWKPAVPPRFVGRGNTLSRLESALDSRDGVSIVGDGKIGKSSLLQTWQQRLLHRGRKVCLIDGQGSAGRSEAAFVSEVIGRPTPKGADSAADALAAWAAGEPEGLAPVVLVDELDHLPGRFDVRFFERLRNLLGTIVLVVASRREVDTLYREQGLTSPFANRLRLLRLGLLDEQGLQRYPELTRVR
jgi:Restriction endonuclease